MSASPCPDVETVLGYADGRLDAVARDQLEAHLDACDTCSELVVHVLREISRPSAPSHASTASRVDSQRVGPHAVEASEMPDTIGRYLVIGHVGAGGMGSVWSAIDPRLQRTVAIKLLDRKTSHDDDERSMQEARALARLAHPNVVAVFEVGRDPERGVYIVMELVDGETLRTFARRHTDDPERIIAAYVQAARGLAAAHAHGIVHRDFKPDNAIVGVGDRVRVLDFGLARQHAPHETMQDKLLASDDAPPTSTIAGTPPYMAPEQRDGAAADARSDQYSFCVALWEALTGARPGPDTVCGEGIPRRIRGALRRGLRRDATRRWPDMHALIDALVRECTRTRWIVVGSTAAVGVAALAFAFQPAAAEPCEPDPTPLLEAWDDDAARELAERWSDGDRFRVTPAADLDRFVERWRARRLASCNAEEPDRSTAACLRQQREQFRVVAELLRTRADRDFVLRDAARALPDPMRCGEDDRAGDDPRALAVRDTLARARGLRSALRGVEARQVSERAVADAQALDDPELLAEALHEHASALLTAREFRAGAETLEDAFHAAEAAGLDEIAADSAAQLVLVLGVDLGDVSAGEAWARHAAATIERVPAARRDALAATLESGLGNMRMDAERWDEARVHMEKALELIERAHGPDHPTMVLALNDLGTVVRYEDKADALAYFERALAVGLAAYGEDHPDVALVLGNIGAVHENRGEPELALAYFERAKRAAEAVYPADHPKLALAVFNVGIAEEELDDGVGATRSFELALAIWTQPDGGSGPFGGLAHLHLAAIAREAGDLERARTHYRAAIDELAPAWGETHPQCGESWLGLADVAMQQGDPATAVQHATRALAILERGDPESDDLAEARALLVRARAAAGLPETVASSDVLVTASPDDLKQLRGLR